MGRPTTVSALEDFGRERLSKTFFMRDFLFSDISQIHGISNVDAPIEQVMYIDKRLKEHNLLQAIARVNRVAKGKQRGFIVDYIGLANHLTQALAIYSAEEAQDTRADQCGPFAGINADASSGRTR